MYLSWLGIIRLGFVQMALGSLVSIAASTYNRVMVVELSMLQIIPGLLLALHYFIQISRPNWGFLSDKGGNRTFWIAIGIIILCLGSILACIGIMLIPFNYLLGLVLSIIAYSLIGIGVGASGTSLLAFLATRTDHNRKAAAATITWIMMIFGAAFTAILVGKIIDPYSIEKLLKIVGFMSLFWICTTLITLYKLESNYEQKIFDTFQPDSVTFFKGLKQILLEQNTRWFTIFVFLSMTAYFMQEPILEPYAGLIFKFSVGESTQLTGYHQSGILLGMIVVGFLVTGIKLGSLRFWVLFGCFGSGSALILIAILGQISISKDALKYSVALLGFFNGNFAVGAIGSMMELAGNGIKQREGTRMGLWGAGQAIAAGNAMIFSTLFVDVLQSFTNNAAFSYGIIFTIEGILFLASAILATKLISIPAKAQNLSYSGK